MKIECHEKEVYLQIDLIVDETKIGEAEVERNSRMLSRLVIYPAHQGRGYGTKIVKMLTEKYGLKSLWVVCDNTRAIRVYEKNGYKIASPTMFLMEKEEELLQDYDGI